MSQATDHVTQAHYFRREQYPATIKIGGQCYDGSNSGLTSAQELKGGDFVAVRRISFEILAADFRAAGQPDPRPDLPVEWLEGKMNLLIDAVLPDQTATVFVLRCIAPPQ